jgi:protein involved in polysaccharide export with SLBB domain
LRVVESEPAALVPGYVNRPGIYARSAGERVAPVERERGLRSGMRIARVALRAYEQRVERRAALRDWIATRAASATAPATG